MEEVKQNNNGKRKKIAFVVFAIFIVLCLVAVIFYLRYKATHITTDDAYIDGRIHSIASKVTGTVKAVYVRENQPVKKGDLLLEIDSVDYEVRVKEASSGVSAEKSKLSEIETRIVVSKNQMSELIAALEAAKANLELQEANLRQAERDKGRAEKLFKSDTISRDRYEKMLTAHEIALAQVKAAREQVIKAEKSVETQKAVIKQIESLREAQRSAISEKLSKLEAAELSYSYTKIYAPSDGYVTKKSVEVGNQIQAGQPLMAVVSLDDIWINANYKETQLEKIKPGQKVRIKVDSYPKRIFKGKVESIMAGTGAVFSLFPPENATGNYVKVVQRIPVKILLDKDTDPEHVLRIGMSVVPTVLVE